MYRSKCCKAQVVVEGDDKEGTFYHVCTKCNKACDVVSVKMSKAKFKKLVKRIKENYGSSQN